MWTVIFIHYSLASTDRLNNNLLALPAYSGWGENALVVRKALRKISSYWQLSGSSH